MLNYVGYGFNTKNFSEADWFDVFQAHNKEDLEDILDTYFEGREVEDLTAAEVDGLYKIVLSWINENFYSEADYLKYVINEGEGKKARSCNVIALYDPYLLFDKIRFIDDDPRAEYIRNAGDFIDMVGRYVDADKLVFGDLFEGIESNGPVYNFRPETGGAR